MRPSASLFLLILSGVPHALAARWALGHFALLRERRRVVWLVTALLATAPAAGRFLQWFFDSRTLATLTALALVETFALMMTLFPLGFVMVLTRVLDRLFPERPRADDEPTKLSRRDAIERLAGAGAFGAATVALGWGSLRGRHDFTTEEVVVKIPGWPRALEGYTIAQVSDIHVGVFTTDRELDEGFEVVRRVKPDLVVATGDLVDFVAEKVDFLTARLLAVGARDGACAILGNHDHYAGPEDVADRVRRSGVRLLVNEGLHLRAGDGGGFALLGVDDLQGRRRGAPGFRGPDLAAALASVRPDRPRILLAHQPQFFREAAGRVALQLSGHTHGGQINPGVTPAKLLLRYVAGRYVEEGSTLWVNRGYGVVGPPSRIGAPPEITKIVLVSG